jgi:6-phosphofructokinase
LNAVRAAIAHGGGPTAVLNSSLAGVVEGCRERGWRLFGARFGLGGLARGEMADLTAVTGSQWAEMARTPGSVIGSSRARLSRDDLARVLAALRREDIRVVFYTGGNGSMAAALELSRCAREVGYEMRTVGIPKTIDNDLAVTHHTPGYASTAYFFACAARDVGMDNRALPSPVCVLETLGRNAGWIVAATALARKHPDDAPHLIYFPEARVSLDSMAADVERVYRRLGRAVVAVCEGQLDESGQPFGADVDRQLASNLGHTLAKLLSAKLGLRARAEKPGLLGRCCGPYARERDLREARLCGLAAVEAAAAGENDAMVALDADGGTFLAPVESVAGFERRLLGEYRDGADVAPAFLEYAAPLIGEVSGYPHLE